jgi:hypothetical protein
MRYEVPSYFSGTLTKGDGSMGSNAAVDVGNKAAALKGGEIIASIPVRALRRPVEATVGVLVAAASTSLGP